MRSSILLFAALVACAEKPTPCDVTFTGASPADGTGPTARDTTIEVAFDGMASEAPTITVTGPDGAIAGSVEVSGNALVFSPSEPFPENAEIAWEAVDCGAQAEGAFTTGELEERLDPAELTDQTYAFDLTQATWVSPAGAGDLIGAYFAGTFLIGVEAATDTELDCIGAAGEPTEGGSWQQDPCYATIDFDTIDFATNPYFNLVVDELEFTVEGITAIIHDAHLSGGITTDELVDGRLAGEVDMRDYQDVFGTQGCEMLETYLGTPCAECASDGAVQCLWVEAVDVSGARIEGLTVVTNEDPEECDPDDTDNPS